MEVGGDASCRHPRHPRELVPQELPGIARRCGAESGGPEERERQQVALQAHLLGHPPQGRGGPLAELEVGEERTGVVASPDVVEIDVLEVEPCRLRPGDVLGLVRDRELRMSVIDRHRPRAVWASIRRDARRAVDRSDLGSWIRGGGRGVEGGILDLVAHGEDIVITHGLDIHQGTAMVEPELAVIGVGHGEAEVEELWRRADVELDVLEDGLDRVALEAEGALHPLGVDGAGPLPLIDGDVAHRVGPEGRYQVRHARPVNQVSGEQELRQHGGELVPAAL